MAEVKVEIIDLQPAQRRVARLHDVLAAQAHLVGFVAAPEHLARHEKLVARPAAFLEDSAHDDLGLPGGIGLGVVEEIDARFEGGRHQLGGGFTGDLLRESDPGAERKRADLQARFSEATIFHDRATV